jgi:hypothetical protein
LISCNINAYYTPEQHKRLNSRCDTAENITIKVGLSLWMNPGGKWLQPLHRTTIPQHSLKLQMKTKFQFHQVVFQSPECQNYWDLTEFQMCSMESLNEISNPWSLAFSGEKTTAILISRSMKVQRETCLCKCSSICARPFSSIPAFGSGRKNLRLNARGADKDMVRCNAARGDLNTTLDAIDNI